MFRQMRREPNVIDGNVLSREALALPSGLAPSIERIACPPSGREQEGSAEKNEGEEAMKRFPDSGNTFDPVALDALALAGKTDIVSFATSLTAKLEALTDERAGYYNGLRGKGSWVNRARSSLVWLGAAALLLTALATVLRLAPEIWKPEEAIPKFDAVLLIVVLVLYAVMAAISFAERSSAAASGYFRHIGVIIAIRNLWTQFQFEQLKLLQGSTIGDAAAEARTRVALVELAQTYCTQLDALASAEGESWRDEFKSSLTELNALSQTRLTDIAAQLQKQRDEIEQIAKKQEEARAAQQAVFVNLTLTGDFDGEATIFLDGSEKTKTKLKAVAVGPVLPGQRVFRVSAQKAGAAREAEKAVLVKAGEPSDLSIMLA